MKRKKTQSWSWQCFDPFTGKLIHRGRYQSLSQVQRQIRAQIRRPQMNLEERVQFLKDLGARLEADQMLWALQMAREMGKPLAEGLAEMQKSAKALRVFAERGSDWLKEPSEDPAVSVYRRSAGNLLAIMPWNFPVWQVVRALAPAVLLGSRVLLKHADSVSGVSELWGRTCRELAAGSAVPLLNLRISHGDTAKLIQGNEVSRVTFTGSTEAGRKVAQVAAKAIKKCTLELGGADAFLILRDADVARATKEGLRSRLQNGGQSCIAAKRFFVAKSRWEEFVHHWRAGVKEYTFGDPQLASTRLGPLVSRQAVVNLAKLRRRVLKGRAELVSQHSVPAHLVAPGCCFSDVELWRMPDRSLGSEVWTQEFFGPIAVAWVFPDESEEKVISAVNSCVFGLGASIWTEEVERAQKMAQRLDVGSVFINSMVRSDPSYPFAGRKQSGYGAELGKQGLDELAAWQVVATAKAGWKS